MHSSTPKHNPNKRKRAPLACLQCRARKVRCDASHGGTPCINCRLDGKTCVIATRAARGTLARRNKAESFSSLTPTPDDSDKDTSLSDSAAAVDHEPATDAQPTVAVEGEIRRPTPAFISSALDSSPDTSCHEQPIAESSPELCLEQFLGLEHGKFLLMGNLRSMTSRSIGFLVAQGCFNLPKKSMMDELVRQYFLYVHPMLPLLSEGRFWRAYTRPEKRNGIDDEKVPLLLFWSMLFASSCFLSQPTTESLGYSSVRSVRASFYKKAKCLFNLETESSSTTLAQSSLLLTFWTVSPKPGPVEPNTLWLRTAIHYAEVANTEASTNSQPHYSPTYVGYSTTSEHENNILARIWWCCIIRDRSLSLGLRRNLQIPRRCNIPETSEFEDEIHGSLVYDAHTKKLLICGLVQLLRLCMVMTDLLLLSPPTEPCPLTSETTTDQRIERLSTLKKELQDWYGQAKLEFTPLRRSGDFRHHSVTLFTSMMHVLYNSAMLNLHHREVLLSTCLSTTAMSVSPVYLNPSRQGQEIKEASLNITDCLIELMELNLIQYFTGSAVALSAFPFLLNVLDIAISSLLKPSTMTLNKQKRLHLLIQVMKEYNMRYEGVGLVSQTVHCVITQFTRLHFLVSDSHAIGNWIDILTWRPSYYLHLALTIDLCLQTAKVPAGPDVSQLLGKLCGSGTCSDLATMPAVTSAPSNPDTSESLESQHEGAHEAVTTPALQIDEAQIDTSMLQSDLAPEKLPDAREKESPEPEIAPLSITTITGEAEDGLQTLLDPVPGDMVAHIEANEPAGVVNMSEQSWAIAFEGIEDFLSLGSNTLSATQDVGLIESGAQGAPDSASDNGAGFDVLQLLDESVDLAL